MQELSKSLNHGGRRRGRSPAIVAGIAATTQPRDATAQSVRTRSPKTALGACLFAVAGIAASANGQAVTNITGGAEFGSFFGDQAADVVGYRLTVTSPITVTDLGIWNADTAAGAEGLTSDHTIGIWDSAMSLLTSNVVGPAGTVVGDWTYNSTTPVVLSPGEIYTIGASYSQLDQDNYLSSPSSILTGPEISILTGVAPSAGDLGFVFPEADAGSGRFGPNFLYTPVPAPGGAALAGFGLLLATRRRRRDQRHAVTPLC